MLDYFHSNSVNGDLDINTIMIVPCGLFVSTILFGFFFLSLFITGYLPPREISLQIQAFREENRTAIRSSRGGNCLLFVDFI